jgi:co-chaperonin GroES (HSP10)
MSGTSASNTLIFIPKKLVQAIDRGVIIEKTMQYASRVSPGGIFLPDIEADFEKKYQIGEVMATGENVPEEHVSVGDIVVWNFATGFRLPNGGKGAIMHKLEYTAMSVMVVLPNLYPEKRHERWDNLVDENELESWKEALSEQEAAEKESEEDAVPGVSGGI